MPQCKACVEFVQADLIEHSLSVAGGVGGPGAGVSSAYREAVPFPPQADCSVFAWVRVDQAVESGGLLSMMQDNVEYGLKVQASP